MISISPRSTLGTTRRRVTETTAEESTRQVRRFPHYSFVLLVLGVALVLRWSAAVGPLWLDEIWSLKLAQQARSITAILTELHSDNNHPLNTLFLRAIGPDQHSIVYRLPPILAGTVLVAVGGWTAARWGRVTSLTAATLLATSYLLVHYSSEARGYSLALCAAYCGWESALRYVESRRSRWALAFWCSCLIGLLSHPITAHFLLASACWLVPNVVARSATWSERVRQLSLLLSVPLVGVLASYRLMWQTMDLGGGPPYSFWQIVEQTSSLSVGGPPTGSGALLGAAVAVSVCSWACWLLRIDPLQTGLFFVATLLIPVIHALAVRPPFLFPRYFLMAAGFVPLLAAFPLAQLYRTRRWGRWAYAVLLLGWIGSNLVLVSKLTLQGRGQYGAALDYIARNTEDTTITISSDHNFGVKRLIEFYAPRTSSPDRFAYINGDQWPPSGPCWLILHRYAESNSPPPLPRQQVDGHIFQLERMFDCAILSGWQWWCFRRQREFSGPVIYSNEKVQRDANR
jgi:hypothetical protein